MTGDVSYTPIKSLDPEIVRKASSMLRSSPSAPLLPPAKATKTLNASLSADLLASCDTEALRQQQQDAHPARRLQGFTITDLLPENQSKLKPQHNSLSPVRSAVNHSLRPSQSSSDQYIHALERPENVELFAYSSALCHRVTGRYMTKHLLQQDEDAQRAEIERIQRDPDVLEAIASVQSLSTQFKRVAQDTMGHRKELGHALFRIEESYLKLFEKLLEISLRMYWRYEHEQEAERREDKAAIAYWKQQYSDKSDECTTLKTIVASKEILLKTQQISLADIERQRRELQHELHDQRQLETDLRDLRRQGEQFRTQEREVQAELTQLQEKYDAMVVYERNQQEEMREQQKRLMDEMKRSLREKDRQLSQQDKAIRELSVQIPPPVLDARSTQTEVGDDGLWDVQDGVPLYVSKNAQHKMMWRRFNAFMRCTNCRGQPIAGGRRALLQGELSREADQDYVDVWSLTRTEKKLSKKQTKRLERIEEQWQLPNALVRFLSNLPKSVMAFRFEKLESVIHQIETIYDDKFESDQADEADGVAADDLPNFIAEFFLKTFGLRQSAEIALYRFLISVKSLYHQHSHVQLFARFLNAIQGNSDGQNASLSPGPTSSKRSGDLDRSFLRVFLTARHFLLRPPPTPPLHDKKKATSLSPTHPIEHVVQVDAIKKWVPLNHAIAVLKWFLSYLPEDEVIRYCREVEYLTAMYAGHAITEISGNRLAVRAEMRRVMLGGDDSMAESDTSHGRVAPPRIVVDAHKVLLLLMSALEQRREVMEAELIDMFKAGDANHDCVLSLTEFGAIIRTRVPHFSDRRILRMFREALTGGADQSFALSMDAFVHVCREHGLAYLLPADRFQDPFVQKTSAIIKLSSVVPAIVKVKPQPAVPVTETIPEEILEEQEEFPASARAEEVEEDEDAWRW